MGAEEVDVEVVDQALEELLRTRRRSCATGRIRRGRRIYVMALDTHAMGQVDAGRLPLRR